MGHKQPPTPVACDNSTAAGIMNRKVKQQRSKAMDMRFYWVQDRVDQKQFRIYWAPGRTNLADFPTKHHPPTHHRMMRPVMLGQLDALKAFERLRGCVKPRPGTATSTRDPRQKPTTKPAKQAPNTSDDHRRSEQSTTANAGWVYLPTRDSHKQQCTTTSYYGVQSNS
jgi:hypothetical protein